MTDEARKRLAGAVRARRRSLGFTQSELAAAAGVSEPTIRVLESGRRIPKPGNLRDIARALRWSDDSLQRILDGEEPEAAGDLSDAERRLQDHDDRLLTTEERLDRLEAQLADLKSEWELAKLTETRRRLSAEASRVTEQEQARQEAEAREHQAEAG